MKKILSFLLAVFLSMNMMAENVEKSIALNVAKTFMPETEFVVLETTDFVNFYIFSSENSFVIVSADDRATPILAYSNEYPFVVEEINMCPGGSVTGCAATAG